MSLNYYHKSVLLQEAINALAIKPDGNYIDATFGGGGHTRAILQQLNNSGSVIAFDQDQTVAAIAADVNDNRFTFHNTSFIYLAQVVQQLQLVGKINGVLLDLGVSSPQLDEGERGFSFLRDGPLDMRMNKQSPTTAADIIANFTETQLANVFFELGEEKYSKPIARAIVAEREKQLITSTVQLAEIISKAHPKWPEDKHPATKCFQALRIYVNQELQALEQVLPQCLEVLAVTGRLVVISFHSLEDRIVKNFIRYQAKGDFYPLDLPIPQAEIKPNMRIVGKAIRPNADEIVRNPRARSSVLRVAEVVQHHD